jgi:hypothetical protein
MNIRWRTAWRYPQTLFLLGATGLGYVLFLGVAGLQVIPLLLGLAIALGMVGPWFWQFRRATVATSSNLLEAPVMLARLEAIAAETQVSAEAPPWRHACQWASASQAAAAQIAATDSLLGPDLMETLLTVAELARQVAGSVVALEQVQTEQYRTLTQRHLQASSDRLQATHDQLQQLRDQMVLSQLTTDAAADTSLPDRLQLLIDANKLALNDVADDRP